MPSMDEQTRTRDILQDPSGREALLHALPDVVQNAETMGGALDLPVGALATLFRLKDSIQDDLWRRLSKIALPDRVEPEAVQTDLNYEGSEVLRASATVVPPTNGKTHTPLELVIEGPSHGNPFTDVELHAIFELGGQETRVGGFYDGGGRYIVRFLPERPGEWHFHTISTARSMDNLSGKFLVEASQERGMVRVADDFHFSYTNGNVFRPVGTTLYAWTHQSEELQEETLVTLATSPFTKVRMCVFPKAFIFNDNEPALYPFERKGATWDTERFDPAFFQHLEQRIHDLGKLGIEADIILFHPYDRWGFQDLGKAADDRYIRYVVRRLAALPNVWWSLANEYDFVTTKRREDWERFARIVVEEDHAGHLLSIHNGTRMYDYSADWATHCSIQKVDYYKTAELVQELRDKWGKPVVLDEIGYEGDLEYEWGSLPATEVVRRAWETTLRGGYYTHGETYYQEDDQLWWAKGGHMVGQSADRIAFLDQLASESPTGRLEPIFSLSPTPVSGVKGQYEIHYNGYSQHKFRTVDVPEECTAEIDVIDSWVMTIDKLPGTFRGRHKIEMPVRPYMALRMRVLEQPA
jgi:hypothetical protein